MKAVLILAICLTLASCTTVRIATVTSEKVTTQQDQLIFENDTVKIVYSFWANGGKMNF